MMMRHLLSVHCGTVILSTFPCPCKHYAFHYDIYFLIELKPVFHYPSSRPEFTGRVDGPWTRVHFWHPSTRAFNSGVKKCTRVHETSTRTV